MPSKPAFWLDGNIHSVEVAASMACLYSINELLTQYGHDALVTRLVDRMAFYILPRINPDGVELALADPPRYVRSGVRSYPFVDEDSGLTPGDVDGDGRRLTMRVADPAGPWKTSAKDPRAMIRRGPDEEGGDYYRLFPEGRVVDYDGWVVRFARTQQGLDFNRNFPAIWEGEGTQKGAGPFPLSEAETQAVARFITERRNLTGAITYHTSGGIHLRPLSFKADDEMPTEDLWTYRLIGKRATEITGYQAVSVYHDFRYHPKEIMTGAFDDWLYDQLGVFAWTTELWDIVGRATGKTDRKQIDWYRDHPEEDDLAILRWDDEQNGGRGFVDWYPFEHPELGGVELGGWDSLYSLVNAASPPARRGGGQEPPLRARPGSHGAPPGGSSPGRRAARRRAPQGHPGAREHRLPGYLRKPSRPGAQGGAADPHRARGRRGPDRRAAERGGGPRGSVQQARLDERLGDRQPAFAATGSCRASPARV